MNVWFVIENIEIKIINERGMKECERENRDKIIEKCEYKMTIS